MGQQRRKYTDDYKAAAVERLYEPGLAGPKLLIWAPVGTNKEQSFG